jgi:hypothetical protein
MYISLEALFISSPTHKLVGQSCNWNQLALNLHKLFESCKDDKHRDITVISRAQVLIVKEKKCNVIPIKGIKMVKQFLYRRKEALRVPAGCGFQISRQSAHEGGKVVSPTHRPPLPPVSIHGSHFC